MNNNPSLRTHDLQRIKNALLSAGKSICLPLLSLAHIHSEEQAKDAERTINEVLMRELLQAGEGWLSEETPDDPSRQNRHRVWVVDPIDGTKEFINGVPEWCISVGLIEAGQAVAGGVFNPMVGDLFLGSLETGVQLNDQPVQAAQRTSLNRCVVLASHSEMNRGEWECFRNRGYEVRAVGSIAYKLALVAAGRAEATWTLCPKHEWDVAAGVALVTAAGGEVYSLQGEALSFNRRRPLFQGLIAHCCGLAPEIRREVAVGNTGNGSPSTHSGTE
jgi:myo-inositol-1(or 4)-monophosphatase